MGNNQQKNTNTKNKLSKQIKQERILGINTITLAIDKTGSILFSGSDKGILSIVDPSQD